MKGLDILLNPEQRMTEDEIGLQAEQFSTDLALLQHKQLNPIDPLAVSAEWCDECGMEIPELRRRAVPGVTTCVDCQRSIEFKDKRHG